MKKLQVFCDSCGKEVESSYFRSAKLRFRIDERSGGSVGGNEDIYVQNADLCCKCAHKLQRFIKEELNIEPTHPLC